MERRDPLIEELIEAIPEFYAQYEQKDLIEMNLVYPLYESGGGLATFVTGLLRAKNRDEALLDRCFSFIERLANSPNERTREVVNVGFLESLGEPRLDNQFIGLAMSYMGPKTRSMYEDIKEYFSQQGA